MIDMMSLYYFRNLARTENMAYVAEKLHVTQPTLSKSLTKLEEKLGYPLFDREHGRIRLNENGKIFLDCADRIFMELHDGIDKIQHAAENGYGSVSYGTDISTLLERAVADYAVIHPYCKLCEMQGPFSQLVESLVTSELDFAITTKIPNNSALVGHRILQEKIFIVAGATFDLPSGTPVKLSEVIDYPFICDEMEISQTQIRFFCQEAGIIPDIRWVSFDGRLMLELLYQGLGIAMLPAHSIQNLQESEPFKKFKIYPIADVDCTRTIAFLRRKSTHFSPAKQDYLRFLTARFEKLSQAWPDAIQAWPILQ